MGYSGITVRSRTLLDITPPGSPELTIAQSGKRELEARVTLPTVDSDGQEITGLTELIVVLLPEIEQDVNPFENVLAEDLAPYTETEGGQVGNIFLDESDAGELKAHRFPNLTIGTTYWVAATVKDDS
ncbi:MAG: hypothetical protein ACOC3V_03125 [bacterium]